MFCTISLVMFPPGCYPAVLVKCTVVLVPSKSNRNGVITEERYSQNILSNFKERSDSWLVKSNIISNSQFACQADKSTADCILLLTSVLTLWANYTVLLVITLIRKPICRLCNIQVCISMSSVS